MLSLIRIAFHILISFLTLFTETSNEHLSFEQWEENYLNFIKDGGDVFEYEAGENVEQQDLNDNKENSLTRQQLVDQVQGLKALANHSSNSGNIELLMNVQKTIRDIEWMIAGGSNIVQAPITNYFRPAN